MSTVRFDNGARLLSAAVLTAVWLLVSGAPAAADETSTAHVTAKRSTSSLGLANTSLPGTSAARNSQGFANGFVYAPGSLPGTAIRGRLNVGKSGVYVPYYGSVGTDPSRPSVQGGLAGIGYGLHGWDISLFNAAAGVSAVPGADVQKNNPSLSFSIRF